MHLVQRASISLGRQPCAWAAGRSFCAAGGKIDFGKHSGLTFAEVYQQHPDYCTWLLQQEASKKTQALRDFLGKSSPSTKVSQKATTPAPVVSRAPGTGSGSQIIDFGKHNGMTFEQCHRDHPDYSAWLSQQEARPKTAAFLAFIKTQTSVPSSASRAASPQKKPPMSPPASSAGMPGGVAASGAGGGQVIDFGKHKGLTFEQCQRENPGYSAWLLQQPDAGAKTAAFLAYVKTQPAGSAPRAGTFQNKPSGGGGWKGKQGGGQKWAAKPAPGTLTFGRHKGKPFEEVCQTDAQYCQWIVKSSAEPDASAASKAFAAFVEEKFPEVLTQKAAGGFVKKDTKATGADSHSVSSGMKAVGGNKYPEKTFSEVFELDQNYCRFIVEQCLDETTVSSGWQWPFTAYVQHRWLQGGVLPGETFTISGQAGCLRGTSFAISGSPAELKRNHLEEMITFFGGKVQASVSPKTTYLVVGKGTDGRGVESGAKYSKALEHNVSIIEVSDLLEDLRNTGKEGRQETFQARSAEGVQA